MRTALNPQVHNGRAPIPFPRKKATPGSARGRVREGVFRPIHLVTPG